MTIEASQLKPVLFVVTSNRLKGATGIPTGFNLAEVTHPLEKLQTAGIRVEIASILGGAAPLDGLEDMTDPVIARYWADSDFRHALANTLNIGEIDPWRYSAIFFAGGHGTMWDFPDNIAVQNAIQKIDEAGGIVSAVCHGPAAFVNARRADGNLAFGRQTLGCVYRRRGRGGAVHSRRTFLARHNAQVTRCIASKRSQLG